jgi:hypothetical protein
VRILTKLPPGAGNGHEVYREHVVATLFGQVTVRLLRFRCAACGGIESGVGWPSHCRATPKLVRLQAHLSALTTYRTAADLLEQMFPVNAAKPPEIARRHALKVGEMVQDCAATTPETMAPAVVVTLDSTFIRSCENSERHLEVRVGNVETKSGGRQVLGSGCGWVDQGRRLGRVFGSEAADEHHEASITWIDACQNVRPRSG